MKNEIKISEIDDGHLITATFKTAKPEVSYTSDSGLEAYYDFESDEWNILFESYPEEEDLKERVKEVKDFIKEIKQVFGKPKKP